MHDGVEYALDELRLHGGAERMRTAIALSQPGSARRGAVEVGIPAGTPQLLDFEVSWLLMLPAEPEQASRVRYRDEARFAFRYGPIRDHDFGGEGAAEGLSVSASDGGPPLVVEVRHEGVTIFSRVLGSSLPRDVWMRLSVNVTAERRVTATRACSSTACRCSWSPLRS